MRFSEGTFYALCDELGAHDADLQAIIDHFGYPPFWNRPNTYETLVHIILEQQVSLASARAALEKLRQKVGEITPERVACLSDKEFRAAYFSRQKTAYVKGLTAEVLEGRLELAVLPTLSDDEIRARLLALKGIGNWTVDVYFIFVLHHADVFPFGDVAAVNALKAVKQLPKQTSYGQLQKVVARWQPYRTIATMLLWHQYLSVRGRSEALPPA